MSVAKKEWPLGPIIIGVSGFCVLLALGIWQFTKVQWKNSIIAEAEQRLLAPPSALPTTLDPPRDDYKRVMLEGVFLNDEESYFLTSRPPFGPGFDVIVPFVTTDDRRVLVDRGYVPQSLRDPAERTDTKVEGTTQVVGVLRWPDDTSAWTLDADLSKREFYSRSVPPLADFMETEPVMVMASETDGPGWPRGSKAQVNIRNQHLPYAIQWFAIAAVWALMSLIWFRKVARPDDAE
jgi:surfeit locus 1 family protein